MESHPRHVFPVVTVVAPRCRIVLVHSVIDSDVLPVVVTIVASSLSCHPRSRRCQCVVDVQPLRPRHCVFVVATVVASSSFAWYRSRHHIIRRRAIVRVVVMEEAGEDGEDQDQDQEYSRLLGSSRHHLIVHRVFVVVTVLASLLSRGLVHVVSVGVTASFVTSFVVPLCGLYLVMTEEVGEDGEDQDQPEHEEYSPLLVSSAHFLMSPSRL
jgi:hypothetical protein